MQVVAEVHAAQLAIEVEQAKNVKFFGFFAFTYQYKLCFGSQSWNRLAIHIVRHHKQQRRLKKIKTFDTHY